MRGKGLLIGLVVLVAVAGVAAAIVGNSGKDEEKRAEQQTTMDHSSSNSTAGQTSDQPLASEAATTTSVDIKDYAFTPATIKVKVGTTVTWTNRDGVEHSVVADQLSADAPNGDLLSRGESYEFTFNMAGTYKYHCSPHPYMQGTVIVE